MQCADGAAGGGGVKGAVSWLMALVAFVAALVVVKGTGGPAPDVSTLAARINGACRPGFEVGDWTTVDDNGYQLRGTVVVECWSKARDRFGGPRSTYRTAVDR